MRCRKIKNYCISKYLVVKPFVIYIKKYLIIDNDNFEIFQHSCMRAFLIVAIQSMMFTELRTKSNISGQDMNLIFYDSENSWTLIHVLVEGMGLIPPQIGHFLDFVGQRKTMF